VDINEVLKRLGELGIDSVFVEGGGELNDSLLRSGCVNRLYVFIAPKVFGGTAAKSPVGGLGVDRVEDAASFSLKSVERFDEDILLTYLRE